MASNISLMITFTERACTRTVDHSYEGWARLWHFDQHAILLYDATRDDGEEL